MSTESGLEGAATLSESTATRKAEWTSRRKRGIRERRHSQRLPLAIPVFARGVDDRGKEFLEFTTTLNIGAGGVLLAMRKSLPPNSKVVLEIPAAPLPKVGTVPEFVRTLPAHVVRVTFSEPSYLWALRFNQPLQ
jgi:hypothetical protein